MMHDMAITEDFAILLDVPLVFRPEVMVTKNRLPLVYDKSRPARFGIIPKRPKSGKEVRWFELDPGEQHAATCCRFTRRPSSCPACTLLCGARLAGSPSQLWQPPERPRSARSGGAAKSASLSQMHPGGKPSSFQALCVGRHVQLLLLPLPDISAGRPSHHTFNRLLRMLMPRSVTPASGHEPHPRVRQQVQFKLVMSCAVLHQTPTLHPCCAVMIFHVANAWQEGKDIVKLYACCFEEV